MIAEQLLVDDAADAELRDRVKQFLGSQHFASFRKLDVIVSGDSVFCMVAYPAFTSVNWQWPFANMSQACIGSSIGSSCPIDCGSLRLVGQCNARRTRLAVRFTLTAFDGRLTMANASPPK